MRRRLSYLVSLLVLVLAFVVATETHGSQEGMLRWTSFTIDSEGIGSSGPVTVSGKQDKAGITAMTVKAFGRVYEVGKGHLERLKSMHVNGMQLSYEGGRKKGGRTIYIQLSSGFFAASGQTRKFVAVREDGTIVVQEPRSP